MILDNCYKKALEILQENRAIMDNMVKVLFEKETIYTEEVNMLFAGKTADEVIAYIDEKQAKKDSYKNNAQVKINIVDEKPPFASTDAPVSSENTETQKEQAVEDSPTLQENTQRTEPEDSDSDKK